MFYIVVGYLFCTGGQAPDKNCACIMHVGGVFFFFFFFGKRCDSDAADSIAVLADSMVVLVDNMVVLADSMVILADSMTVLVDNTGPLKR